MPGDAQFASSWRRGRPMKSSLLGQSLIGFSRGAENAHSFRAVNTATQQELDPLFLTASKNELDIAAALAEKAFISYGSLPGATQAAFIRAIAVEIETIATELIARAHEETALSIARLQGELARTCGQLRLFASVVGEGSWVSARIDRSDPVRKPLPKPGIRSLLKPLGPVAVFGASNFPLAFSVAGGDTASALAAGCPVVAKAHPAHPGTSELAGRAIQAAVAACDLPPGVFSLLLDGGYAVGGALVADPRIKAVGFTGSRRGGVALLRIAQERREPIPVYAEMSSINPVFLLPAALASRGEAIGRGFAGSLTMGAGQFCTNPGLVFAADGPGLEGFLGAAREALAGCPAVPM